MKAAIAPAEDLVVNKVTVTAERRATRVVASVTWQRTVVKVKNVTTVVVWDMSAAIVIKLHKQKFATGVNNPGISPVIVPMTQLSRPRSPTHSRVED